MDEVLEDCLFFLLVALLLPLSLSFYLIDAIFDTEIMCDRGACGPRGDDD